MIKMPEASIDVVTPTGEARTLVVTLTVTWWLRLYLRTLATLCRALSTEPDMERVSYWLAKGIKIEGPKKARKWRLLSFAHWYRIARADGCTPLGAVRSSCCKAAKGK
jgi:hypothetical protein